MKLNLKIPAFLFLLFLTVRGYAQINPASVINLGAGLGTGISAKIKDGKKRKAIENSISEIELNGLKVKILRVPEDKIISNAKGYIVRIQNQLDNFYNLYKNNEHVNTLHSFDDLTMLKALDNNWATEYYYNELIGYRNYEQQTIQKEKHNYDSIATATKANQKRTTDSIVFARKMYEDSIAYAERIQGYLFVNKAFTFLKNKPSDKSQTIGKVYLGSYLKLLGYSDNSTYVKVAIQDIEGYVNKNDLTDTPEKINASNADLATYKSRRYYKYEPNYEYVEEPVQPYAASTTNVNSSKSKVSSSSTQQKSYNRSIRYIRGPKGGCYYMSGNSKVYVDRSYCN
ncbi:MAG: hypothetical protein ABJB11_13720 [Ferruginibacter sp.]